MVLTPYLQLRHRLSQVWLNNHTIILALMAIKLVLFGKSLQSALMTAKTYTIQSCPSVDSVASSAVSIPHYLSKSANFMIRKSVDEINEQTLKSADMMLTISQSLIIFALEMMIGTYACLIVAAVDGAVDVAVNGTETMISWVNGTLSDVTDEIEDGLTDLSSVVNSVVSAAEKVKDFFDGNDANTTDSFNKFNLTVNGLKNLHIPASINSKLEKLKDNTPDFTEVKYKTESLISIPFDYVKNQIQNVTLFDSGGSLYVPPLEDITVCSNNRDAIEKYYNELAKIVHRFVVAFTIVLVIVAVAAIAPALYSEYRKWSKLSALKDRVQTEEDPIMTYETIFNRYPTAAGGLVAKMAGEQKQTHIQWVLSYIFSSRATVVLGLSLAGFAVIALQYIIIDILQRTLNNNNSPFDDISHDISSRISGSIMDWTDTTNDYLEAKEIDMNEQLFSWVRKTADSVNDTISEFVDDMNTVIADAFNGTILYDPMKTVVGCVIENKLIRIEEGLTWVYDNAEVTFPRVSDEYLSLAFDDDEEAGTCSSNETYYGNGTYTNGTTYATLAYSNGTHYNTTASSNTTNSTCLDSNTMASKTRSLLDSTEKLMKTLLELTVESYKEALNLEIWIALALFVIWLSQFVIAIINVRLNPLDTPPLNHDDEKRANDKMDIGYPRPLTREEQKVFGYPYVVPFTGSKSAGIGRMTLGFDPKPFDDIRRDTTYNQYPQRPQYVERSCDDHASTMLRNVRTHSSDTETLDENPFKDDTDSAASREDPFDDRR